MDARHKAGHDELKGLPVASAVSPLAPKSVPAMPPIAGVKLATAAAGIKYLNRTDVLLALLAPGTAVAGVFTKSKCPSAPVEWCRANLKRGKSGPRALVVNSGNANAFTGKTGRQACQFTAKIAARAIGCAPADIFLASTGVIGEPLNAKVFDGVMEGMVVAAHRAPWLDAAKAIMTTDTFPKVATAKAKLGKSTVTINGMAKGAGMIAPDMATMLSFIFTDAPIGARALQTLLSDGVTDTFNAVTIDGDTSTSDTLLAFATGAALGRAAHHQGGRSAAEEFSAWRSTTCWPTWPNRWRATAKARASSSRSRSRARCPNPRRAGSPCRSPTRRW